MDDYADDMRLKNTLSHEVHVTMTELTRQVEKLDTSSKMERDFPQRGRTGYIDERKEKHLGPKLQVKFEKKNRNFRYVGRYG